MKLHHITFTGIDGRTDLGALWEIQQEFPMVEWGVLVSAKWRDKGNRYFNPTYLDALEHRGLNLSAHLCGRIARAAVRGNLEPFREWACGCDRIFNRCQLNISTNKNNPEQFFYHGDMPNYFDEVILQQRSAKDCGLFLNSPYSRFVSVLLDASGGRGIDTPIEVLELPRKIGYAGGINAGNVAEKLSYLLNNEHVIDFWIDMENGVRTDDWFDIKKVVEVLRICKCVIDNQEPPRLGNLHDQTDVMVKGGIDECE